MSKKSSARIREEALRRIAQIRAAMADLEFLCSGTLIERRKVCGRSNCRCAEDPQQRHGPYYEWSRRSGGKLIHRVLSQEQAQLVRQALRNHRAILRLLRQWERQTVRVIEALKRR